MSLLLEDLAEETSTSNRRTADRLEEEARQLEELRRAESALETVRQRLLESARQSTEYVLSTIPRAEGFWRLGLARLRTEPTEDARPLLQHLVKAFEASQRQARSARSLWQLAEQLGFPPERLDELEKAEQRFRELAEEARLAFEHRTRDWQPADPERLAQGLQRAREGKTVTADEARARFRRSSNSGGAG
jgi:hypothetical protein